MKAHKNPYIILIWILMAIAIASIFTPELQTTILGTCAITVLTLSLLLNLTPEYDI